jgi:hypothetical protein
MQSNPVENVIKATFLKHPVLPLHPKEFQRLIFGLKRDVLLYLSLWQRFLIYNP